MREFLTENTFFVTVAMFIKESTSLLLAVEGDDDYLALKKHNSTDLHLMAGVGGRPRVLGAAKIASDEDLRGVRFLVDIDYDNFTNSEATRLGNVLVSANHDIFMDLIGGNPEVLETVIDVSIEPARRRPEGKDRQLPKPSKIKVEAIQLAGLIAAVRIISAQQNLAFDFKRFSFSALNFNQMNVPTVADMVMTRSSFAGDRDAVILDCDAVYTEISSQVGLYVGDHDFFSAISRVLKRINITKSSASLQEAFIIGMSCANVVGTSWFSKIQDWCALNNRSGFTCSP